ncbi:unnamed protein product [Leptosia nina]|uniref:Uncharacterized protein n=1 Tax=Leptosia nina TaxID=320188 RepID=A0AAV1JIJ5_9NEOP
METDSAKEVKTYSRISRISEVDWMPKLNLSDTLSSREALQFLLNGTLRLRVCRYCLNITNNLCELDEVLVLAGKSGLYEVTIKDIIGSFHPIKVIYDENYPNKICTSCFENALQCYLFTQRCEQAERAFNNFFEDINEKFNKLDPMEPVKKRGKPKLKPNHNILYTEHRNVIDYAEPIINLIHLNTLSTNNDSNNLECPKCWQVLPNQMSLVNHEKAHPQTMWYHCKECGKAFVKYTQLKRHMRLGHEDIQNTECYMFTCKQCGCRNHSLNEHLLHIEKHRFTSALKDLVMKPEGNCDICFNKDVTVNLNESMHFQGMGKGLVGEKTIHTIASTIFPDITLPLVPGNKICKTCLDKLLISYIFILSVRNIRYRLDKCITTMVDSLENVDETKNVLIEISQNILCPDIDVSTSKDGDKEEFLEDEFRVLDSNSDIDMKSNHSAFTDDIIIDNPAKNVTKTYSKKFQFSTVNGYQRNNINSEYLGEFLRFKKKQQSKYTCPLCSKHFISDYFLKEHVIRHIFRILKCKMCSKSFKSKFYLREHVKTAHILNLEKESICGICGRSFENSENLKKHMKTHYDKECPLCNKYYRTQVHFDIHMQRHIIKFNLNRINTETCSFCEKACSNANELSLHINKVHLQMKPYHCDMCEKQFYTEYNLSSHKKLHSLKSKEECKFCHKNFKCRKTLVVHLRKHLNIKPHICPICTRSFYSESGMKLHMKKSHGGRYCCRICKQIVDSSSDLKNHLTTGCGVQSYM